jgi:hypothetical protein
VAGLCKVPFMAALASAAGLTSSGFLGRQHALGRRHHRTDGGCFCLSLATAVTQIGRARRLLRATRLGLPQPRQIFRVPDFLPWQLRQPRRLPGSFSHLGSSGTLHLLQRLRSASASAARWRALASSCALCRRYCSAAAFSAFTRARPHAPRASRRRCCQLFFLAANQLGLAARLFFAPRQFGIVHDRLRRAATWRPVPSGAPRTAALLNTGVIVRRTKVRFLRTST